MKVAPKKHLGQHFLKDESIAERIAGILDGSGYERIIEIGPGMGVLTKYLLQQQDKQLTCVEIDKESVNYLHAHYPQLQVLEEDFLQIDLGKFFKEPLAVIGNFPYNISSQIVFKVLEHEPQVRQFGGMFQKEVARRLASGPGTKDYGILSVLLQTYYEVRYLFTVDEHVFHPPPKVKSGVIIAVHKEDFTLPVSWSHYKDVVKTAFNQRRKTLRNALAKFALPWENTNCAEFAKLRAEQLSYNDFIALASEIEAQTK